ncbi:hypothetical protein BH18THE2_BH18THE2_05390 [soil metagenome]
MTHQQMTHQQMTQRKTHKPQKSKNTEQTEIEKLLNLLFPFFNRQLTPVILRPINFDEISLDALSSDNILTV